MTILQSMAQELEKEAVTTRKMLERIPDDKYEWQPHEKSMQLGRLATHIAELPSWLGMTLKTNEVDFSANDYVPTIISNKKDLLELWEKNLADGKVQLVNAKEEQLEEPWILRNGKDIYINAPKRDMLRIALSQIIHHRAQLGVYLRLLNIPIPGSYGPSADDPNF
ncbi:MAG: DinB family protein [Chitinophagaceae bacterium]